MRSYSTLISSILLVSAVMADNPQVIGGVNLTSPNEFTFKTVQTALKVPNVSGQPFDSASVTVSLDDGVDCEFSARVGVNFEVGSDPSEHVYFAWFQLPNLRTGMFDNTKVPINPGNTVVFGLTAPYRNSSTDVYVYIENGDTGDTDFNVIEGIHEPCGMKVAWLVNNIPYTDDPTHYHDVCNFGTLELTRTSAYDRTGNIYGPKGQPGVVVDETNMSYDNGTTVATTTTGGDSISFAYVLDHIP